MSESTGIIPLATDFLTYSRTVGGCSECDVGISLRVLHETEGEFVIVS